MPILEPVLNYRMILPDDVNPAAFMEKLKQLEEEDPQLYIVWVEEFKEIHVQLMGQVQMEILKKYPVGSVSVWKWNSMRGSIVYKETLAERWKASGHFEPPASLCGGTSVAGARGSGGSGIANLPLCAARTCWTVTGSG